MSLCCVVLCCAVLWCGVVWCGVVCVGAARFEAPNGLAIDPTSGTIYVADTGANQVFAVDAKGQVTVAAGSGVETEVSDGPAEKAAIPAPMGVALDAANQVLYISGQFFAWRVLFSLFFASLFLPAHTSQCCALCAGEKGVRKLDLKTSALL